MTRSTISLVTPVMFFVALIAAPALMPAFAREAAALEQSPVSFRA